MNKNDYNFSDEEIIKRFGPIEHYNALLFKDIIARQADSEGALAVGGNGQFGSNDNGYHEYDIGTATPSIYGWEATFIGYYKNPNKYPSLILGGSIDSKSTNAKVYAGGTILNKSYQNNYNQGSFRFISRKIEFVNDDMVDSFFKKARHIVDCTSEKLLKFSNKTISSWQLKNIGILSLEDYVVPDMYPNYKVVVLNLDTNKDDTVLLGDLYTSNDIFNYDAVIINIHGENIRIGNGNVYYDNQVIPIYPIKYEINKTINELASRLIFHFPDAKNINMSLYALIGSVIAPNADVSALGGSINGMLVANSLHQQNGMEMHAFTIALGGKLWLPCDPTEKKKVKIVKCDDENPEKMLEGAIFSLYIYNVDTNEYDLLKSNIKTLKDGSVIIENLDSGKYKLVEIFSPKGYELSSDHEILFQIS